MTTMVVKMTQSVTEYTESINKGDMESTLQSTYVHAVLVTWPHNLHVSMQSVQVAVTNFVDGHI